MTENRSHKTTANRIAKKFNTEYNSGEGVDIKILLDGLGTILATGTQHETMPEDYVPLESVRRFLEKDSDIRVRQVKNPWLTGDHVKSTIIDDQLAFTGGMNIGREYRYVWHDMMVETRGPVVDILRRERTPIVSLDRTTVAFEQVFRALVNGDAPTTPRAEGGPRAVA